MGNLKAESKSFLKDFVTKFKTNKIKVNLKTYYKNIFWLLQSKLTLKVLPNCPHLAPLPDSPTPLQTRKRNVAKEEEIFGSRLKFM